MYIIYHPYTVRTNLFPYLEYAHIFNRFKEEKKHENFN